MSALARFLATGLMCLTLTLTLALTLVLTAGSARAAAELIVKFDTPVQAELYETLLKEFRCLKCQNQNLWDSRADLAQDLRVQIHDQIVDGQSRQQIHDYLTARYGDFVLYNPPFKAITIVLWLGPFVLLVAGLGLAWRVSRRSRESMIEPEQQQLNQARALLDE